MQIVEVAPVQQCGGDLGSNLGPGTGLESEEPTNDLADTKKDQKNGSADTNNKKTSVQKPFDKIDNLKCCGGSGSTESDSEDFVINRRWGRCWPFVVPDTDGPAASEYPFDVWTLQHISFGVLWAYAVFIILTLISPDRTPYKYPYEYPDADWINTMLGLGFLIGLGVAILWEIVENSGWAIRQLREVQDANYAGDSYINIIFDVIVFIVGYVFVVWTSWYGAPIWYVVSELFQLWYFRNSLTMITITVAAQLLGCPAKKILEWHAGAFGGKTWFDGKLYERDSEELAAARADFRSRF